MAEALKSGNLVADIRKKIAGEERRWRLSLRTSKKNEARSRKLLLQEVARAGEVWVLDALSGGALSLEEVVKALAPGGKGIESLRPHAKGITLKEASDAYLLRTHTRAGTREIIERVSRQLLANFGERELVSKVDRTSARKWLYHSGWSAKTQTIKHCYAQAIFDEAIKLERERAKKESAKITLVENVWNDVRPMKVEKKQVDFLPLDLTHSFLTSLEGRSLKLATFMALGFLGALRVSESLHLRWSEDVNLDEREIYIQVRGGRFAWKPKTPRSVRVVEIPARLVSLLMKWKELSKGPYVFNGDRPLNRRNGTAWAAKAFDLAGMVGGRVNEGWTYHHGRHSAISNSLRAGVPVSVVAKWAGDTQKTIMDTYSHVMREDAKAVALALDWDGTP